MYSIVELIGVSRSDDAGALQSEDHDGMEVSNSIIVPADCCLTWVHHAIALISL